MSAHRSHHRLEILLCAAFLEWAQDLTHERALELAEGLPRVPWLFRAIALNAIAYFAHGSKDEEAPILILERPSDERALEGASLRQLLRKAAVS